MQRFPLFAMCFVVSLFLAFGWYHLGKFETTDEHLWKYDRIGQYWKALGRGNWSGTYINDKPGVTVALVSGLGLLAEPHPERTEYRKLPADENKLTEAFQVDQSERTNVYFRLPVLGAVGIILCSIYFLALSVFGSTTLALFLVIFVAGNPILLGLSQIINPDSLFWPCALLATLTYLGWLLYARRSFAYATGLLVGLALLSKYTAFLLFPFFGLLTISSFLFLETPKFRLDRSQLIRQGAILGLIFILSLFTFAFLLPATWTNPGIVFKGLSQFFVTKHWPIWLSIATGLVAIGTLGAITLTDKRLSKLQASLQEKRHLLLLAVTIALASLVSLTLINAWSGQSLSPVTALRDAAYANEPQAFNFRPIMDKTAAEPLRTFRLVLMEFTPFLFSLPPLFLAIWILGWIGASRRWLRPITTTLYLGVSLFIGLYLALALSAKVVTNVRYLIVLYPLLALLLALIVHDLIDRFVPRQTQRVVLGTTLLLVGTSFFTFWNIRPFYFSYTNFLLPLDQSIHDSWGHGSYEAAQFLNQLPKAEERVIWSNSDTVCRFFVGRCLKSRRIDLSLIKPDYFVINKRGVIKLRNQLILENNPWPERDPAYYLSKIETQPDWRLNILGRPDNFISIVRFEQ